jgi:segregation and condensation protein B
MSLKAKIEAVIYASEEPVTLAQLVGLLGEEAQAELDRAVEAQQTLTLEASDDAAPEAATVPGSEVAEAMEPVAIPEGDANSAAADASPAEAVPLEASTAEVPPELAETADTDGAALAKAEKARMARLRAHFRGVLDELMADYASPEADRGLEIREVGGGFRLATKPEYHDAVRGFVKSLKPPLKLTLQALETLAVVAYKQPVTAPEISEIRGVDSAGVLGSLLTRKLITTAGRKQVIGRPILYKTTKEFLLKFGLKDVNELPSIEEFEKMAGQMAEQEEMAMGDTSNPEHSAPESPEELEQERESHEPQADGDSAPASNVSDETGDKASVDGRISSLPPNYDDEADDPSAQEAEIQANEQQVGGEMADFTFDDGGAEERVIGSPEGDGDFETDGLPSTGPTSSGGQINTGEADRRKSGAPRTEVPGPQQPNEVEKAIDEVSHGTILP